MDRQLKHTTLNQFTYRKLLDVYGYLIYLLENDLCVSNDCHDLILECCEIIDKIIPYLT